MPMSDDSQAAHSSPIPEPELADELIAERRVDGAMPPDMPRVDGEDGRRD